MEVLVRIAVYPGTFDPITNGHIDIIRRASKVVDKLVVAAAENIGKSPMFSLDERRDMVNQEIGIIKADNEARGYQSEIEVTSFNSLLMHFVDEHNAKFVIRGLRAVSDFEYEFQLAGMNRKLNQNIETIFLMSDVENQIISSKFVKEIVKLNGDIKKFTTKSTIKSLKEKYE